MEEEIRKKIFTLADEKYKEFHNGLCPNTDNIVGVRVPVLREYAKQLAKEKGKEVLNQIGNQYYEEIMLQGMLIGMVKMELEERLDYLRQFIPKSDNWAVCDVVCAGFKFTKKYPEEVWRFIQPYLSSDKEFEVRFGVIMAMDYYINDTYVDRVIALWDKIQQQDYYVKMGIAWAISVAYIKYSEKTMKYLQQCILDDWTYNKALQKIVESYRVSDEEKQIIRKMKRRG